jgi:hypothetical protein
MDAELFERGCRKNKYCLGKRRERPRGAYKDEE